MRMAFGRQFFRERANREALFVTFSLQPSAFSLLQ